MFGCLTHEVPLSLGDAALTCSKGGVRSEEEEAAGIPGRALGDGMEEGQPGSEAGERGGGILVPDPTLTAPPYLSLVLPFPLLPSESLAGFLLSVSATSRVARLRIPFPQTGTWFLTLRSLCGAGPR